LADYLDHVRRLCSFLFVIAVALVFAAIHMPESGVADRTPVYVLLGLAFLTGLVCHLLHRHLERSIAVAARAEAQRELAELRERFVDEASHELRTPLTSLIVAGEFLARGDLSPEQHTQYVGFVQESARRLKQIVDDLPTGVPALNGRS